MPFVATCIDLKIIILNEVREISFDTTYRWDLKKKSYKYWSLVVKWLGLGAFIEDTQVESLIGELRSHNMHGVAKKKKKIKLFTK